MLNIRLRHKAKQLTGIIRSSALQKRVGGSHAPVLAGKEELAMTFIGHSAFFIQLAGKNILVDPNFARWLFVVKRLRHPGTRLRDLPPIDYVLVTHAHFDHLHRPSLRRIAARTRRLTGQAPQIIVPRDVGDLVRPLGFRSVIELDWWQRFTAGDITITHTPARHWGARLIRDTHRGYGSYVISAAGRSIYHAGDTAYFEGFHEIGGRLHPEIALLPIGAYHPDSFRRVHTSPEDALQGFQDLGSRWMVPMHYGTFRLSQEPMDEPVQRLLHAAADIGVSERVLVLPEGITRFFPATVAQSPGKKHA